MTAPRARGTAGQGGVAVRGFLLIGVAVVLGFGLLVSSYGNGGGGPLDTGTAPPGTARGATSTLGGGGGATTSSTVAGPHTPGEVKVLVMNGTATAGVAKAGADALKPDGYVTLDPATAKSHVTTTVIYVQPGFEADGAVVAAKLGVPATAVQPLTDPVPAEVGDAQGANVVAVIGPDAPIASGTTATTAN